MVKIIINSLIVLSLHANPFFFGQQTPDLPASASDNFNYPDLSSLGDQPNWEILTGAFTIDNLTGISGRVRAESASANSIIRRTSPTFAANQECHITLDNGPVPLTGNIGPAVRCQSGAASCYEVHYDQSGGAIYLAVVIANSWSLIDTTAKTYVTGDKLKLSVSGSGAATRLTVSEDTGSGWVTVFTDEDPGTYLSSGQPGMYGYGDEGDGNLHAYAWVANDL